VSLSSGTLVELRQMQRLLGKGAIELRVGGEDGYYVICASVDAVSIEDCIASRSEITVSTE
jgi:hypothetical protein